VKGRSKIPRRSEKRSRRRIPVGARAFKFNRNQYPIQNYYLRVVGKDSQGRSSTRPSHDLQGPGRRLRAGLPDEVGWAPARAARSSRGMSWVLILEQFLNGLQFGLMLFLLAAGLTLVFGIMD